MPRPPPRQQFTSCKFGQESGRRGLTARGGGGDQANWQFSNLRSSTGATNAQRQLGTEKIKVRFGKSNI